MSKIAYFSIFIAFFIMQNSAGAFERCGFIGRKYRVCEPPNICIDGICRMVEIADISYKTCDPPCPC
uniref:Uncharacterized protein n=1 Tax=Ditylenchus dipsaci TaxID=166011 RepID=A0A915E6F8_9BILA